MAPTSAAELYRRILLVVDLGDDIGTLGARARAIASACGAELTLLHVVEYVPVEPMGETLLPAIEVEEELIKRAATRLRELGASLGLAPAACRVEAGNIKSEIVRVAAETKSDLVVIGSRERHGLSILVNLTEDSVLHGAHCDVLAVRLK